jgi:hypothetical protein
MQRSSEPRSSKHVSGQRCGLLCVCGRKRRRQLETATEAAQLGASKIMSNARVRQDVRESCVSRHISKVLCQAHTYTSSSTYEALAISLHPPLSLQLRQSRPTIPALNSHQSQHPTLPPPCNFRPPNHHARRQNIPSHPRLSFLLDLLIVTSPQHDPHL